MHLHFLVYLGKDMYAPPHAMYLLQDIIDIRTLRFYGDYTPYGNFFGLNMIHGDRVYYTLVTIATNSNNDAIYLPSVNIIDIREFNVYGFIQHGVLRCGLNTVNSDFRAGSHYSVATKMLF